MALPEIAAEHEIPEVDVAEPAGSAGEPAGSAAPSDQNEVAVPAPVPPVPGPPRLRVHASPRQILEQASPNSTLITASMSNAKSRQQMMTGWFPHTKIKAFPRRSTWKHLETGNRPLLMSMIIAGANGNL